MGLLDDAIREHLELKRKHGANPEDVARQEQEALGPGSATSSRSPKRPRRRRPSLRPRSRRRRSPTRPSRRSSSRPRRPVDELPEGEPGIPEEPPAAQAPGYDEDPWLDDEPDEVPADEALQERPRRSAPATAARTRTCSRRRPTSSRRRPSTTACGSSRSRRATSTGTSSRSSFRPARVDTGCASSPE